MQGTGRETHSKADGNDDDEQLKKSVPEQVSSVWVVLLQRSDFEGLEDGRYGDADDKDGRAAPVDSGVRLRTRREGTGQNERAW